MKPLIQIGTGASLLLVSLFAATVFAAPVPHTFTNGQPADAEQVNANFQNLSDRIDAVSTATKGDKGDPGEKGDKGDPGVGVVEINFDPYRHNFSSKTFRITGNNDLKESE